MTWRLLDLYGGEGGAWKGYTDAGWYVVGVDLRAAAGEHYPGEFYAADALEFLAAHWQEFDAVHASPPCQHASAGTRARRRAGEAYPELVAATRAALRATGLPYVIENVRGALLESPLWLCGTEFGLHATDVDGVPLELWRHRGFESNVPLAGAGGCRHGWLSPQVAGVYGGARRVKRWPGATPADLAAADKRSARLERHGGYVPRDPGVQERLLGVDWMTAYGRAQCIPPAYAEHVGRQLLEHVSAAVPALATASVRVAA